MNYKEFRSQLVSKGMIVRGGAQAMTIFSPNARLEVNLSATGEYTVYNFNTDETLQGLYSLLQIAEMLLGDLGSINLMSWYFSDWRVRFKGNTLYVIGQKIDEKTVEPEDLTLALQICDDMKYLILMSDYIPDEHKEALCKDIMKTKEEFVKVML